MNRGRGQAQGRTFQKPKNRKYALKRLWDYLYNYTENLNNDKNNRK